MFSILFSNGIFIDPLSLFFTILIILIFIPVFIYSFGYVSEYKGKYLGSYNIFLTVLFGLSMVFVVLAKDSMTFMVFWEIMSASSFFLVIYEYKDTNNIHSGINYFIMTHISGFFLMVMFSFLFKYTGTMNFDGLMDFAPELSNSQTILIFILAVLGFGAKAGFVPLHAWLPRAHPSAPSNASALMSGVMLKVSLYGLIRVMFYFLKDISAILSLILVIIGVTSAIYAILNALVQKDIKKLLAYSSAENIGIILATIGLSLVFKSYHMVELSAISLMAALFHILNHAVFKSLLFTSAGSVLFATGTKNMNELGGLYSKMKFATICAFIGTAAISVIPPFNGFASEFLIFKTFVMASASIPSGWPALVIIFAGILLALTSGATVYTSVKSFGITYLGSSRSEKAEHVHKIPVTMNIGLGILGILCILLGVLSPYVLNLIAKVSANTLQINETLIQSSISYEITILSIILFVMIIILTLLSKVCTKNNNITIKDTWACGFNNLNSNMQYTGNGLSQPMTRLFPRIVGYSKKTRKTSHIYVQDSVFDVVEKYMYEPIVSIINAISKMVVRIQMGKVQVYVMYIFIALVLTILLVYNV